MSAEDIRALIQGLVEVALAGNVCADFRCSGPSDAGSALTYAVWQPGAYVGSGYVDADDLRGVPLPEAFDALVLIHETLAARALAEGGDDPFLEAARRDHAHMTPDGPPGVRPWPGPSQNLWERRCYGHEPWNRFH